MRQRTISEMNRISRAQHSTRWLAIIAVLVIGVVVPVPASAQSQPTIVAPAVAPVVPQPTSLAAEPAAQAPASAAIPSPATVLNLPRDLSPWGMFMAADVVVKIV